MSLGEHLEELRWRLILGLVGVAIGCCLTIWFSSELFALLCRPLLKALQRNGLPPQINFLTVTGPFMAYLKVSLVGGAALGAPWLVYQFWKFVSVGLYEPERQVIYVLAPLSGFMAALGIVFMYFAMLPVCLGFFIGFAHNQTPLGPTGQPTINLLVEANQYITFVALVSLGILVGFQLPVVMLLLGWMGVVEAAWLARYRRHCIFACAALGALLTPADVLSMFVLSVPLYALFEAGLVLMKLASRWRRANEADGPQTLLEA